MLYEWILANKELLKVTYALIICFICAAIVLKTDRMFKLSDYQGLRYFRNAFFFYGLAFIVRFILGGIPTLIEGQIYFFNIKFFFEFFIVTAGFFLLYSLVWKHVEREKSYHSFLNIRSGILYAISFSIVFLNFILNTSLFMYLSQIALFITAGFISYQKWKRDGEKHVFLKYYFIIMILGLIAWILNMALDYFLNWNKILQMGVYVLNVFFFFFFLYAITKITKDKDG